MTDRLPWRRTEGGFVAYPEGDDFPERRAEIRYEATSSTKWHWFVRYGLAKAAGLKPTSQSAADDATVNWERVKLEAAELADEAAAEAAVVALVDRLCGGGDVPLEAFAIADSDSDRLRHIIWLVRDRGPGALTGPAKPLIEACSAELFSRRTGGGSGGRDPAA